MRPYQAPPPQENLPESEQPASLGPLPAKGNAGWHLEEPPEESVLDYLKALPQRWASGEIAPHKTERTNPTDPTPAQGPKWHAWLFWLGLALYLATRLIALDKFPITFFSDEAIQTLHAQNLLQNGFRGEAGRLFPLFFSNAGQYNLSLSVYLQLLAAPFARSVALTRALPALVSLLAPLLSGLAMRDFFKQRHYWLMPFVFSAVPAWFLHSRTALEASLAASLFAVLLYAYLRYRLQDPRFLPWVLLAAGACFYSYAPMQLVVILFGLAALALDWPYHWQNRKRFPLAFAIFLFLAFPYLLFRTRHPQALGFQLSLLGSYWLESKSLALKLLDFLARWLQGLNPLYWFIPGSQDLARHSMHGYGHMPVYLLPFALWGFYLTVKHTRTPAYRTLLIALLLAPGGAALVAPAITRLLATLVPLIWLSYLGLEALVSLLESKMQGRPIALFYSGILGFASIFMLTDALVKGPTWYQDYGLYGMQWGAPQVFNEVQAWQDAFPQDELVLSPTWANGTDILARYSLPNRPMLRLESYLSWTQNRLPLDEHTVLVATPQEYAAMMAEPKFLPPQVLKTLNYPNGQPGFYFLRLAYAPRAEALFAEELAERQKPEEDQLTLLGQEVQLTYSRLDMGSIAMLFDGDPNSLARGLEANPFLLALEFQEPVTLEGIRLRLGAPAMNITVSVEVEDGQTFTYNLAVTESDLLRGVPLPFDTPHTVRKLSLSLEQLDGQIPAHVHIWELSLNPQQC